MTQKEVGLPSGVTHYDVKVLENRQGSARRLCGSRMWDGLEGIMPAYIWQAFR